MLTTCQGLFYGLLISWHIEYLQTLEDLYYLYHFISEEAEDQNYEAEKRGKKRPLSWDKTDMEIHPQETFVLIFKFDLKNIRYPYKKHKNQLITPTVKSTAKKNIWS